MPWASALILGLVAGLLLAQIPGIQIQRTLDLDGLISLLVGLILFFGLNLFYQREAVVRRAEKDILIRLTQDALDAAEALDQTFSSCHNENPLRDVSVRQIYLDVQRYSNSVYTLARAVKECNAKINLSEIQEQREEYRYLVTDSPFPSRYEQVTLRQQQGHHRLVREALVTLIVRLNRL